MTTLLNSRPAQKFSHPDITAKGEQRASVDFRSMKTLWFNTGTLCNIECVNCYIESSPTNDRLVYLTHSDVVPFLDELEARGEVPIEVGFTGGEPFMAPDILNILEETLQRGHDVLVLTNAMQPMMRPRVKEGLARLIELYRDKLVLRVSLDHHSEALHDEERGAGSYKLTCAGLEWLAEQNARVAIAGRTVWDEPETTARQGYADLCQRLGLSFNVNSPTELVLFPEMDPSKDPPEITTDCWGILNKDPSDIMCASQRMVVKRKGAGKPTVLACTLLPYDTAFELGDTLAEASEPVSLNHPYCASFCVLGGGSCSA